MTMPSRIIPMVAGASLYFAAGASIEAVASGLDRFELWNACRPVALLVLGLEDDKNAAGIGLTEQAVTVAVRSQLRGARLYTGKPATAVLSTQVFISRLAYSIDVKFKKWVKDAVSSEGGWAITWSTGSFGTHGGDSGYILSSVGPHIDEFIDAYLRVNEPACKR